MVSLDWDVERADGVTLVALHVTNPGPARTVRVENRLDGPLWPPRSEGRPVAGWDDAGFEGAVESDGRLAIGYASPGRPADPPAEVVQVEPIEPADGIGTGRVGGDDSPATPSDGVSPSTPADVVREFGDPVVPRAAVPIPDGDGRTRPSDGQETERVPAGDPVLARLSAIERRLASLEAPQG